MMDKEISLKSIVGEELLNKIQNSYLKYLESSAAVYEVNGDYAAALFASKYCDFLNQASRKLAGKTDEEALKSGRWICHEDCWATSLKSIKDKKPCEIECSGGIKIYAAPIIANDMVIGSNNAGVSNPPTDEKKIKEIAEKYKVDPKELLKIAKEYVPRPEYVSNAAKSHISVAAEEIAEIFMRKRSDEEIILRKKAEEKIRQTAEEWNRTFDAIADFLFIQDKELKFIKVNKAFADALKVKPEELIGKKCYNLLHKSDKPWPNCPAVQTLNDKKPHTEEVIDSNIGVPLLVITSPIFNDEGEVISVVHYARDITERKKAEEELTEVEERYRGLIESVILGTTIIDTEYNIVSVNNTIAKWFNRDAQSFIGKKCFHEFEGRKEICPHCSGLEAMRDKKSHLVETRGIRDDGTVFFVRNHAIPILKSDGTIKGFMEIIENITEQKKVKEELERSEASLVEAQKLAHLGSWDWDVRKNQLKWSDEMCRIWGYDPKGVTEKYEDFLNTLHPDDLENVKKAVNDTLSKNVPYQIEYRIKTKKGDERVIAAQGEAKFDEKEKPIRMFGTAMDITERKKAEEEIEKYRDRLEEAVKQKTEDLRKSEEQLRLASESASIGMWFWNVKTGELVWTDICKRLFGLPLDKKMSYEVFLEALHPDDRKPTDEAVKKSLDKHTDYNVEYSALWPDGSMHWLKTAGKPYYDAEGNIESLIGIVIDIDAEKRQRIKLQEKIDDLERFRKATVDREFRMKELRDEMERLKAEKGK
jgi:PAS domain S-box-containing protein